MAAHAMNRLRRQPNVTHHWNINVDQPADRLGHRDATFELDGFGAAFFDKAAGAAQVFGLSTQDNVYQTEMASRLHLPFPVLSDEKLELTRALRLPVMEVAGLTLIKRLTLIVDDARITHVFYPVFPPDQNAADVLAWLKQNPA